MRHDPTTPPEGIARSIVYAFTFPPQDFKLRIGDKPRSDGGGSRFNRRNRAKWVRDSTRIDTQGQVRDLRPRWALEEAGIAYAVGKLDAIAERPADYYQEQPFGQVPSYHDDTVSLLDSGAIVLHIGRDCETLLPADPPARVRATTSLIAALNTIEPYLMQLVTIFAAGDLMMRTVLRIIEGKGVLDRYPNLVAYKKRCQGRPAFQAALAAQLADFEERGPTAA